MTAWSLYVDTRDYFMLLTEISNDMVPKWSQMDKAPVELDGEVQSVYRHFVPKGKL